MMLKKCFFVLGVVGIMIITGGCSAEETTTPVDILAMEKWDLVFISDSSGWGAADLYAEYIRESLGKEVEVHDLSIGGLTAGRVLRALRQEGQEAHFDLAKLPELIAEAEVIVFYANPEESVFEENPGDWHCTGFGAFVNDCSMNTFTQYRADLDAIYEAFFALRKGKPTLIRAFDAYNPLYKSYQREDVYEACWQCWQNYNTVIHQAAQAHGVPVAEVYRAFNGRNYDEDPNDKGWIGSDKVHTSKEGQRAIADLLNDLDYEPITP